MAESLIQIQSALADDASACECGDAVALGCGCGSKTGVEARVGTVRSCCGGTDEPGNPCHGDDGQAVTPSGESAQVANAVTRALRTSSYVIYVDLPQNSTEMLLVHGYTGTFDKVSKRVATFVRALEDRRAPKPLYGDWTPDEMIEGNPELPDQLIAILLKRGYLTYLTRDEELERFVAFADGIHAQPARPSYVIMPTYDCNLRCFYCFQDHMRTNPDFAYLLQRMTHEMVDRIFDAMPRIEAGHGIAPEDGYVRPITLFGGEPLLRQNHDLIEHIVSRAHQGGTRSLTVVTNATDLDAYENLLGPENLAYLQVTLDGVPQEHDKRRVYPDGQGSFATIADNITMALSRGASIGVRLNIDRGNIAQLPRLAQIFHERGWAEHENFIAYTAPVHKGGAKTSNETLLSSWELDQALDELRNTEPAMSVIGRPDDRLKATAMSLFSHGGHPDTSPTFCGAHNGMYVVDRFGDLYACWEKTGNPNIRIGRICQDSSIEMSDGISAMWRNRTVTSNPVCKQCRFALHCGGGCAVLAEGRKGRIDRNYCDGFGFRFRAMIAEAFVDHAAGKQASQLVESLCDN